MLIRKQLSTINPLLRWRWDAAGVYGWAMTKRGAASAARRAVSDAKASRRG